MEAFIHYLSTFFPKSRIAEPYSLGGQYEVRFELGGDWPYNSPQRIEQATNRACILFNEFFPDKKAEIWLLAYEDLNPYFDKLLHTYLPELLKSSRLACYEEIELACQSGILDRDEDGNSIPDFYDAKLTLAKLKIEDLPMEAIFRGIASFELGETPCIPQSVYFFQTDTAKAFKMYDDRGCYIWANEQAVLMPLYNQYKGWIPPFHVEEIDMQFK